jgi:hypothetical protein
MYLRIHDNGVVALCDAELIGRKLTAGKAVLDLAAYSDFYKGEMVAEPEAIAALRGASSANIVGKKSLAAARKAGLGTEGAIIFSGVPHLQFYRL